jgi:hypothetical protein
MPLEGARRRSRKGRPPIALHSDQRTPQAQLQTVRRCVSQSRSTAIGPTGIRASRSHWTGVRGPPSEYKAPGAATPGVVSFGRRPPEHEHVSRCPLSAHAQLTPPHPGPFPRRPGALAQSSNDLVSDAAARNGRRVGSRAWRPSAPT